MTTYTNPITPLDVVRSHLQIDSSRWPDRRGDYHADCPYCGKPAKPAQNHFRISSDNKCYCQVCGKGTTTKALAAYLGVAPSNLSTDEKSTVYIYHDENGQPCGRVSRYYKDGKKFFSQSRPDGIGGWENKQPLHPVLYNLPEVLAATTRGETIYIAEGEKDADTLRGYGLTATTNAGGAGKWRPEYSEALVGANVVIFQDNDDAGKRHAAQVKQSITGQAVSIKIVTFPTLPEHSDVTDWLNQGHTIDELHTLVEQIKAESNFTLKSEQATAQAHTDSLTLKPLVKALPELMRQKFAPIRWIVPGILHEGAFLLVGKPKLGKSGLALDLGIAVAAGGLALGKKRVEQGAVLYLDLENGDRRLQSRAQLHLRGEEASADFYYATEWRDFNEGGLTGIEVWIEEHSNARLVVVDTLKKVRPAGLPNQSIYDYDYNSIDGLHKIAIKYNIAIVVVHHSRKAAADDFIEEASGSNGLTGAADGIMVLRKDRSKADAVLHITGRDVEDTELAMRRVFPGWELLGDAAEIRRSSQQQAVIGLFDAANTPLTPRVMLPRLRLLIPTMTANSLNQILLVLCQAGELKRVDRGQYVRNDDRLHMSTTNNTNPTNTTYPTVTTNEQSVANVGDSTHRTTFVSSHHNAENETNVGNVGSVTLRADEMKVVAHARLYGRRNMSAPQVDGFLPNPDLEDHDE